MANLMRTREKNAKPSLERRANDMRRRVGPDGYPFQTVMTVELHHAFREKCARIGRSMSSVHRELVEGWVAEPDDE